MNRPVTIAIVLSIALAVLAPLVFAVNTAQKYTDYPSIRVDIMPYDPRDLFYGHYLQFQTNWNWKDAKQDEDQTSYSERKTCLCIEEGDVNPPVSLMQCPVRDEDHPCRFTLHGRSWGSRDFDNGVHRFYVDETMAKPLEDLFVQGNKKFSLDLHITPKGNTLAGQLYVEGVPLKDYVTQHGGKIPPAADPATP